MTEISIGAVGAAFVAAIVSLLGLIIGKEQKVSEFRQAWIDELRKCLIAYLVHINAIGDSLRIRAAGKPVDDMVLLTSYKALNEASHGIAMRINAAEEPASVLLESMKEFEDLSKDNSSLTPSNIAKIEANFAVSAQKLLKFEWNRVKRGESTFIWTKRLVFSLVVIMASLIAYNLLKYQAGVDQPENKASIVSIQIGSFSLQLARSTD